MRCDECNVKKCDTRDTLKKNPETKLIEIIDRNCNEFKPKETVEEA